MTRHLARLMQASWLVSPDAPPPQVFWEHSDWVALWQMREHLVHRALSAAASRANSYRHFHVGGAAFISSRDPQLLKSLGRPGQVILTGANWKNGPSERNTCAEQEIVAQIRQQDHLYFYKEVLALVIAGNSLNEPDRESGVNPAFLHPCNHCRNLLKATPHIQSHTLVVSVPLDNSKPEVLLFEDLLRIHGSTFPDR